MDMHDILTCILMLLYGIIESVDYINRDGLDMYIRGGSAIFYVVRPRCG